MAGFSGQGRQAMGSIPVPAMRRIVPRGDDKKRHPRGMPLSGAPWAREPQIGIEPTTARLRIECSTTELLWRLPRRARSGRTGASCTTYAPHDLPICRCACPGADSNRDAFRHHPLKMACLPISPPGQPSAAANRNRAELTSCLHLTGATGLEPATSRVTVECSNQTELRPQLQTLQPA